MLRNKHHLFLILALSALATAMINFNLTKAIIFDGYLTNPALVSGNPYYLELVNESSKGNWQLGSPFIKEWRNSPYLYPALNFHLPGMIKSFFDLSIKSTLILLDYGAVFVLLASTLAFFLVLFKFNYFGYVAAFAYIFFPFRTIEWSRTINPQVSFIPFALFLLFYFSNFRFWIRELGMAFLTGFLFYIYPYYWTFALVLLGLSDLWEWAVVKKIIWKHLLKYLLIGLVASQYFLNFWEITRLPYYRETVMRIGFLYSRWPAGLYTQAAIVFVLLLFFLFKKYILERQPLNLEKSVNFKQLCIGLAASLLVLNQQLITGVQMEFNSHYFPIALIFMVAMTWGMALVFLSKLELRNQFLRLFGFLLAFGFLYYGFYWYTRENPYRMPERYPSQDQLEVYDWFNQNQIRDAVVYSPVELNDGILLLTNNYLYFHGSQELHLMPTEEIIDRFTYYDLFNSNLTDRLAEEQVQVFGHTFQSAWQKDQVLGKIRSFLSRKPFVPATLESYTAYDFEPMRRIRMRPDFSEFAGHLKKYNVDYLVYRHRDGNTLYQEVPGQIVFENDGYIIKKFFMNN